MIVGMENFAQLITTRRAIRRYEDRPVPEALLLRAVEMATWAPNSGGKQGWHFTICTNRELIVKVADAVQAAADLMASWPEAEPIRPQMERWRQNCAFFRPAPALIAVSMSDYLSVTDKVCAARYDKDPAAVEIAESRRLGSSRLQTAAAATCIMILALHEMGLATTWMAGPLQARRQVEEILSIPPDLNFVALVPVGYPADQPAARPRRELSEVVRILR